MHWHVPVLPVQNADEPFRKETFVLPLDWCSGVDAVGEGYGDQAPRHKVASMIWILAWSDVASSDIRNVAMATPKIRAANAVRPIVTSDMRSHSRTDN